MREEQEAAPRTASDVQRATMNILEDLYEERARFDETQRATMNVLEDLQAERDRFGATQQATLNILEDFDAEKQKVARSLAEKEILLREIHHRVKNNLQVIAGLLSLQSSALGAGPASVGLMETRDRVITMALVHETLYRGRDLGRVDFGEYARALCDQVAMSTGASGRGVSVTVDVAPDTFLPIDTAVPLGLIVNELVTNALKHAFPHGRAGRVVVRLAPAPAGGYDCSVEDDGVGVRGAADLDAQASLGLRLVRGLARQLSGDLNIASSRGVTATLHLPPAASVAPALRAGGATP